MIINRLDLVSNEEALNISSNVTASALSSANMGDTIGFQTINNGLVTTPTQTGLEGAVPINAVFTQLVNIPSNNFNYIGNGEVQDVNPTSGLVEAKITVSGRKVLGGTANIRFFLGIDKNDGQGYKVPTNLIIDQIAQRDFAGGTGLINFSVMTVSNNDYRFKVFLTDMVNTDSFIAEFVLFHLVRVREM